MKEDPFYCSHWLSWPVVGYSLAKLGSECGYLIVTEKMRRQKYKK
jgi:hypothetical protein